MGWVEERWAARGWGRGEGRGLWIPQKQLLGRGMLRKNEQAPPSLIPPSVRLLSSGHSPAVGPNCSTSSGCGFGFSDLLEGAGEDIHSLLEGVTESFHGFRQSCSFSLGV